MERFTCIWIISCAVLISTCNGQRMDVGRLNFQVNRLNRKTDFLQNEVTDLWAAVLTPGFVERDSGNQTRADNPSTDGSRDCSLKVTETIATVQELKSDIKGFMITTRDGLKNEKAWQREMGKNITEMTTNNQHVKRQLDTLDKNFNDKIKILNDEYKELDVNLNNKLEAVDNEMKEINRENAKELGAQTKINEQMRKELNIIRANQDTIVSENDALRQTIIDMQSELTKLQETLTPPPTTATMTTTTTAFLHSCDDGWKNFQGHCYLLVNRYETFDEATAYCKQRNAYLTEITSDLELEFVNQLREYYPVLIGAQYSASEGQFVYTRSRQPVPEKYWSTGELGKRREGENCATLLDYGIVALSCRLSAFVSICEKP